MKRHGAVMPCSYGDPMLIEFMSYIVCMHSPNAKANDSPFLLVSRSDDLNSGHCAKAFIGNLAQVTFVLRDTLPIEGIEKFSCRS